MSEGVGRHKIIKGCVINIRCTKFPSKHHHHRWHIADQSGLICIRQSEGENPGFVEPRNVFPELFTDFHSLDCLICKYCPICSCPPAFLLGIKRRVRNVLFWIPVELRDCRVGKLRAFLNGGIYISLLSLLVVALAIIYYTAVIEE